MKKTACKKSHATVPLRPIPERSENADNSVYKHIVGTFLVFLGIGESLSRACLRPNDNRLNLFYFYRFCILDAI
jgi:hypothetical protein